MGFPYYTSQKGRNLRWGWWNASPIDLDIPKIIQKPWKIQPPPFFFETTLVASYRHLFMRDPLEGFCHHPKKLCAISVFFHPKFQEKKQTLTSSMCNFFLHREKKCIGCENPSILPRPDLWGTRWYFKSDRTNLPAARSGDSDPGGWATAVSGVVNGDRIGSDLHFFWSHKNLDSMKWKGFHQTKRGRKTNFGCEPRSK